MCDNAYVTAHDITYNCQSKEKKKKNKNKSHKQ